MTLLKILILTLLHTSYLAAKELPVEDLRQPVDTNLSDEEFFGALDLDQPGLELVKQALEADNITEAKRALCQHFRERNGRFWWKRSVEPVNESAGQSGIRLHDSIIQKQGAFEEGNWLSDDVFDWGPDATGRIQRMYFLSGLSNAYAYTGDESIVRTWSNLLLDWIDQNPLSERSRAWATMTAGIRLRTGWGDSLAVFMRSKDLSCDRLFVILKSVYEQADLLRHGHSQTSNWLTFEMAGLYSTAVLFPEFKASAEWQDYVLDVILADLEAGWLPDTMTVELSPGYGMFFTNYLHIVQMAEDLGITEPRLIAIRDQCEKLFALYVEIMTPDRMTPALNDNRAVDVTSLLEGALTFFPDNNQFQWVATGGAKGSAPKYYSTTLKYAGLLIARSSWDVGANYLCFDAGPVGYRHAHQDKLGVIVYAYGRQVIFDPGRVKYDDTPHQNYVMDTFAHNTGLVDNRPQRSRWYANPHPNHRPYEPATDFSYEVDGKSAWARGVYSGPYGKAGSVGNDSYPYKENGNFKEDWVRPAEHERQVLFLSPDVFIVQDIFRPLDGQRHDYEIRWHLDSTQVALKHHIAVTTDAYDSNIQIIPLITDKLESSKASAQNEPEILGWKVTESSDPATTVQHIRTNANGETVFLTLLHPLKARQDPVPFTFEKTAPQESILYRAGKPYLKIIGDGQWGQRLQTQEIQTYVK